MTGSEGAAPPKHIVPSGLLVDYVGVVWLSGEDRLDFLNRMSTNALADLQPGQGRATVFTTDAGRAVDLATCYAAEDGIAVISSGPGAAMMLSEHLTRYVLYADRVRVTDASDQVVVSRLLGPGAREVAEEACGADASGLRPGDWLVLRDAQAETWLMRHPAPGGMGGYDVVVPAGAPAASAASRLAGAHTKYLSRDEYAAARVAIAQPEFGAEINGRTNPLELGLADLIAKDKGCYIGQEVITRLESYDKVQRRLVGLRSDRPLEAGANVYAADAFASGGGVAGTVADLPPLPAPEDPPRLPDVADPALKAGAEQAPLPGFGGADERPPAGESETGSPDAADQKDAEGEARPTPPTRRRRPGWVTTAAMLGTGRWVGMAIVPRDMADDGKVVIATRVGPVPGTLHAYGPSLAADSGEEGDAGDRSTEREGAGDD
ncbi:MAG: YgfZ/GcvT domain-containing protein [Anaerolineae bacterium]